MKINIWNRFNFFIKHLFGWEGLPKIIPFIGFGNSDLVFISGLVVEDNGISTPRLGQSKWTNFKAMVKRYFYNEMEGIQVKIRFMDQVQIVTTNENGIYTCQFSNLKEIPATGTWLKFYVSLNNNVQKSWEGELLFLRKTSEFAVISDIDDTVMVSYATQKLVKLRLMLLNNAYTRLPFSGVSAFYGALQQGTSKSGFNPFFYLSNSEWNLYDLLFEFFEFNRIPKGPLLLREMTIKVLHPWKLIEVNKNHKIEMLTRIFTVFYDQKFILIGDSGQHDPEVYSEIVKRFPGRVLVIYIRDIGIKGNLPKIQHISHFIQQSFQIEMVLVKDTEAAAKHALQHGFILAENYPSIIEEKNKDLEMTIHAEANMNNSTF